MSEEVIKVLDELGRRFGMAIDWTSENAIPYLEQLAKKFVNYEIATSIFLIVFFGLLFAIALIIVRKAYPKADMYDISDPWAWTSVIGIMLSFVFGTVFCIELFDGGIDIVTCISFPEKAIIEYVSTLM